MKLSLPIELQHQGNIPMAFRQDRGASIHVSMTRSAARRHLASVALFLVALVTANSAALAGNLDRVVLFDIEAQILGKALLQFGAQAHVQISFAWDSSMAGLRTHELKGTYTGREALAELLKGTPLTYVTHDKTVAILPKASSHATGSPSSVSVGNVRLQGATGHTDGDEVGSHDPPSPKQRARGAPLQEVVVTGSRLRTTDKERSQEIQIYDREQIEQSGQDSVANFLGTLPSVSSISSTTADGLAPTVSLRGMPVGTTLVLLNGRRIESTGLAWWFTGGDFFNLNNIPLEAVQKIEVDESGSSAVYGSDAIAGAVNIITKQDFNGFAADARYGWAKNTDAVRTELIWGRQWDTGGYSITGSYGIDGGLLNSNRRLSASNDYTGYGGPDLNFPDCSRANVFSLDGTTLPGAPAGSAAMFAAVAGSARTGKPPLSQFTYGALNECSITAGGALAPAMHRAALLAEGHLQIEPDVTLFSELIYTHLNQNAGSAYQVLFGVPGFQEYSVSASNPFNPFGTAVGVAEQLHSTLVSQILSTDFFRPLIGMRGTLYEKWQWEISAWQSADWSQDVLTNYLPNSSAIQSALDSSNPDTALDPFVAGPIGSQSLLRSLFADGNLKMLGLDRSAEAFLRGPLMRLPAGDVQAVLGGDYVRSELKINEVDDGVDPPGTRLNYRRTYYAAFGEMRIPVIRASAESRADPLLTVTLAGRHDQYSDFGGDTTEQYGFEVKPLSSLLLRGTYATAFKAPSLPSLYAPDTSGPSVVLTNSGPIDVQLVVGGNRSLKPLTGHSNSFGAIYSSSTIPGLTASVTQWRVDEADDIQSLAAELIVNNASAFPGRVVQDATGAIVQVNDTPVNFGSIDVAGMDYRIDYQHDTGHGILSLHLNGTEVYHYREALIPGASGIEAVSAAQDDSDWAPRWKGTVGIDWKEGWITGHLAGRYTGSYDDYDSTRAIGNFWIVDTDWRFDPARWIGGGGKLLHDAYVEIGATNLLNRAPQFSNYGFDLYGYDAAQMSIVGRALYIQTGISW
ncbi:MAG TPA: TonB-dependent receptor [Steroidobacteraceae bacterium]|nr:TonB-dependent receptor [Steroidobacteraceae bacterium]